MLNGLGFGAFTIPVTRHLLEHRALPWMFGFPLFGGPFYERVGIDRSALLLVAFLFICALEVAAGWLLWNGERSGGILALALLPIAGVFWSGGLLARVRIASATAERARSHSADRLELECLATLIIPARHTTPQRPDDMLPRVALLTSRRAYVSSAVT